MSSYCKRVKLSFCYAEQWTVSKKPLFNVHRLLPEKQCALLINLGAMVLKHLSETTWTICRVFMVPYKPTDAHASFADRQTPRLPITTNNFNKYNSSEIHSSQAPQCLTTLDSSLFTFWSWFLPKVPYLPYRYTWQYFLYTYDFPCTCILPVFRLGAPYSDFSGHVFIQSSW